MRCPILITITLYSLLSIDFWFDFWISACSAAVTFLLYIYFICENREITFKKVYKKFDASDLVSASTFLLMFLTILRILQQIETLWVSLKNIDTGFFWNKTFISWFSLKIFYFLILLCLSFVICWYISSH